MAEILHWVLGDCVQRALSGGHQSACARRIHEITCNSCNAEIARLRTDALDLGPKTDRIAQLEEELKIQRSEAQRARSSLDTLRGELEAFLLCPKCERHRLRARVRGGVGCLVCPDEPCGFFRRDPRGRYTSKELRERTNGQLGVVGGPDD